MQLTVSSSLGHFALLVALLPTLVWGRLAAQNAAPNPIMCGKGHPECELTEFNRASNTLLVHREEYADAIRGQGSKILYSGTVISAPYVSSELCPDQDWRVVLLSKESSNVLVYGPADISEFCGKDRVLLVVPVSVIWARIFHYGGNLRDPLRKMPAPMPKPASPDDPYCKDAVFPTGDVRPNIRPCDRFSWLRFMYDDPAGPIYNSLTQPGTIQGTISFTPAIGKVPNLKSGLPGIKAPAETLNFDAQLYASDKLGKGWIGFPLVFEKANSPTANLNSLTMGISYDIPMSSLRPEWLDLKSRQLRLWVRPPDVRVQYGPEMAVSTPHDINLIASANVRLPIMIDIHNQPSALSIFPVFGIEGGNHVLTHLTETDDIFRKLLGFDSSVRLPFILTHAFLGDKPTTIDFSWRTRYLSFPEPITDYVSGIPETLTAQQRSYWRGSFVVPISTLAQFKVTVQHGALPPDFDYLGYSVNLGLTFGNPGYSEH
jgi:hypothetical protein